MNERADSRSLIKVWWSQALFAFPHRSADITELIRDSNKNDHDFFDESTTEKTSHSYTGVECVVR